MGEVTTQRDNYSGLIDEARKALSAKQFGDEILRLRKEAGLSQKKLASRMKVDPAVVSRVENAIHEVPLDLVMLFALALDQDPHRLANIYWGISSTKYDDYSKQALAQIRDIVTRFYNRPFSAEPLPHHDPIERTPEMLAREEEAHRVADAEKAAEEEEARHAETPEPQPQPDPQPEPAPGQDKTD